MRNRMRATAHREPARERRGDAPAALSRERSVPPVTREKCFRECWRGAGDKYKYKYKYKIYL